MPQEKPQPPSTLVVLPAALIAASLAIVMSPSSTLGPDGLALPRFKRLSAELQSRFMADLEPMFLAEKQPLFEQLSGSVLEISPGAGVNMKLYSSGKVSSVIAVEPNVFVHPILQQHAASVGAPPLEVLNASAANMSSVPTNSVDFVVSSHAMCGFDNQDDVVKEIARVLKEGGKWLFLENVVDQQPGWLRWMQVNLSLLWSAVADGCTLGSETGSVIHESGAFSSVDYKRMYWNTTISQWAIFLQPHIVGSATV